MIRRFSSSGTQALNFENLAHGNVTSSTITVTATIFNLAFSIDYKEQRIFPFQKSAFFLFFFFLIQRPFCTPSLYLPLLFFPFPALQTTPTPPWMNLSAHFVSLEMEFGNYNFITCLPSPAHAHTHTHRKDEWN